MRAKQILTGVNGRGACLREELAAVPGLRLKEGHRGIYERGGVRMHVRLDGSDLIELRVALPAQPTPSEALMTAGHMVGNLRFARLDPCHGATISLVADTLLDGVAHLPGTLAEVALSAKRFLDGHSDRTPGGAELSDERIDEAVDGLGWPEDAAVQTEDGWELRPRLQLRRGTAPLPVRVTRERGGLRVQRVLLRPCSDDGAQEDGLQPGGPALAELALQLNGRIRLARITLHGRALVVEALLRDELVTSAWLGETVRAVAAVAGCYQQSITILTEQPRLAEVFLAASTFSAIEVPHEVPHKVPHKDPS